MSEYSYRQWRHIAGEELESSPATLGRTEERDRDHHHRGDDDLQGDGHRGDDDSRVVEDLYARIQHRPTPPAGAAAAGAAAAGAAGDGFRSWWFEKSPERPLQSTDGSDAGGGGAASKHSDESADSEDFWDRFNIRPDVDEEETSTRCLRLVKLLLLALLFLVVLATAVVSELCLVYMGELKRVFDSPGEDMFVRWMLTLTLTLPAIFSVVRCILRMIFRSSEVFNFKAIALNCVFEAFAGVGASIMATVVIPGPALDIVSSILVLNGVTLVPALLHVANAFQTPAGDGGGSDRNWRAQSVAALTACLLAFVSIAVKMSLVDLQPQQPQPADATAQKFVHLTLLLVGLLLVSLHWWENFAPKRWLDRHRRAIAASANLAELSGSTVRAAAATGVALVAIGLEHGWDYGRVAAVVGGGGGRLASSATLALALFGAQTAATVACKWFASAACKIRQQRSCFAAPLCLASPVAILVPFVVYAALGGGKAWGGCASVAAQASAQRNASVGAYELFYERTVRAVCAYLDATAAASGAAEGAWPGGGYAANTAAMAVAGALWFVALLLIAGHVWRGDGMRMERTRDLFASGSPHTLCVIAGLLLSRRRPDGAAGKAEGQREKSLEQEYVKIYICATMWHETKEEMVKIVSSILRLDRSQPKRKKASAGGGGGWGGGGGGEGGGGGAPADRTKRELYDFSAHVYFDDAFCTTAAGERAVNEFVSNLRRRRQGSDQVRRARYFNRAGDVEREGPPVEWTPTPYGARMSYRLPHGNTLSVHLKDKELIRHRKRWSQVMYLYYLLGWKIYRKAKAMGKDAREAWLEKTKQNTFVMVMDGDTDFQPSALSMLVDQLRRDSNVGAACGRIHPTGIGPVVWYQKFEYAVGHWLQKTTEHVLGCVLCSPGCFSLFRAKAIMDDNVLKTYTTVATEALHYVQYDQGEDRWLCTLMLQQGWRVEYCASADAYTNAPQDFAEFFNQRKRWGPPPWPTPSTSSPTGLAWPRGTPPSRASTSSTRSSTRPPPSWDLPPSAFLTAGSFIVLFKLDENWALFTAVIPPSCYIAICFWTKAATQIKVGMFLTVLYMFLMLATFISIVVDLVINGVFTPNGFFIMTLAAVHVTAALLHPSELGCLVHGFVYALCIPAGYLLLVIYSLVNMSDVSWGTRENSAPSIAHAGSRKAIGKRLSRGAAGGGAGGGCCCCWMPSECSCLRWTLRVRPKKNAEGAGKQDAESSSIRTRSWKITRKRFSRSSSRRTGDEPPSVAGRAPAEVRVNFREDSDEDAGERRVAGAGGQADCDPSPNDITQERGIGRLSLLKEEERAFWSVVIAKYLKPLEENAEHKANVSKGLNKLRNKVTFVYFLINALWLVATMVLQLVGEDLYIQIPQPSDPTQKEAVPPLSLVFLVIFTFILIVQFLAMLYHRVYTVLHFLSYVGSSSDGRDKAALPSAEPTERRRDVWASSASGGGGFFFDDVVSAYDAVDDVVPTALSRSGRGWEEEDADSGHVNSLIY
ncbi:unnamed protein product [Lampetra fluviatilis]